MKRVNRSVPQRRTKTRPSSSTAIQRVEPPTVAEAIEKVLIGGDLTPLLPEQRVEYYKAVCKSLGLNPLTGPFAYILFKETENAPAKLALYAKKDAAEQLRQIHGVSVIPNTTKRHVDEDFATTELSVMNAKGRTDTATGIVYLWKKYNNQQYRLSGQRLADAIMKSETKAKRRATLSVCGLGILDEMDLESVRVVGGVTPEGRIYHLPEPPPEEDPPQLTENLPHGHEPGSEKAKQAEAALARVEEEDRKLKEQKAAQVMPKPEPKEDARGTIEVDLTNPESPVLRGDIGDLLEIIKKHCTAEWSGDWWHIKSTDVATIHAMGQQLNYRVVEILPKQVSPRTFSEEQGGKAGAKGEARSTSAQTNSPAKTSTKGATQSTTVGSGKSQVGTAAASEPLLVAGIIEQATPQAGKSPRLYVLLRMETSKTAVAMTAWDTAHFPFLIAGKGQQCELMVKRNPSKDGKAIFTNIIALRRIGVKEFDPEDGKTPIIQQRTREAGNSGTLFQP